MTAAERLNMDRRRFLGVTGAAGLTLGLGQLAGCGHPPSAQDLGPPAAQPTYRPLPGLPKPDIAGTADGVIPSSYFRYPSNPVRSVSGVPGDGRPVTVLTETYSAIPPSVDRNSVWSHLNTALGSPLQIQLVPQADFGVKYATTVAGDALPDVFFASPSPDFPRTPELMAAKALDLSDHLAGDAILDYPNLANIPTACWDVGRFNGRIYGLPSPRGAVSSGILYRRDDLLAAKGVRGEFGSFAELSALCAELNDPRGGRWAFTTPPLQYVRNMLDIPNFWRYDGTTMQSWWTAPASEQALEATRSLVAAGFTNPDAFTASASPKTWFGTGKAYFTADAFSAWPSYYASAGDVEGFVIDACTIPAFAGGGQGSMWLSFPSFGFAAVSAAAADRVTTILKIADYLAAPFGTAEYLTSKYGVEGPDYALKDGTIVPTKSGSAGSQLGLKYLVDAPPVNFIPGNADAARTCDRLLRELVPKAQANDAVYLYSRTAADRFAQSQTRFTALENDILQGRKPVSAWGAEADAWWKRYGQQMSEELAQAYVDAGRG
jgi:putative aldouronate transport system substrate-binding protein